MSTASPNPSKNKPDTGTGFLRSLGLSLLVHLLLIAALTWGVNWRRNSFNTPVEAELWSANVQQAALPPNPPPAPVVPAEPKPAPVSLPVPEKPPLPKPDPAPVKPPPPPPEPKVDPQIAIEKAKKLKALKEKQLQEQQRLKEQERRREEERAKAELEEKRAKAAKAAKEREKQEKLEKAEKAKAEKEKLAKQEAERQAKAEKEQARLEAARVQAAADKSRADALRRMNQLAGQPTGSESGRDRQDSAPSKGYEGRIAARIKPNVAYGGDKTAAIVATFEVRLNPDGRIVSIQLLASSGVRAWDDAALRAIEKTEVLPLDGGRVHSPMTLRMTPRD
jgi:colicin import membrane protein